MKTKYERKCESYAMKEILGDKTEKRRFYSCYGKVFRFSMRGIKRVALVIDTILPLTFFIPVILANLVYWIIGDKEFMIERKD